MSNNDINNLYDESLKNGAIGAKMIGAGGNGFILFYTENKLKLKKFLRSKNNIKKALVLETFHKLFSDEKSCQM